jgi:multidrug efflux pump subunit AcrA (membrane-fusion protein)
VDSAAEQVTAQQAASSTQLAAANAQLAAAKSKLTAAQQSLADATLTSPIAGTVASVGIAVGDRLGSSGGASQGAAAATTSTDSAQVVVISTDAWVVNASVGSAELAQVKKGLQVEITPTGSTTKAFGTVSSVGIVASSSSSGSASFPVTIAITGKPTGLYAGATGTVAIIVKQLTNTLTVPTSAVHTVSGKTVVYQMKAGKRVNTEVKLGTAFGPSTQVVSGLKAGDQIVVEAFRPGTTTGGGQRTGRTGDTGGPPGGFPAGGFPAGGFPAGGGN